MLIVKDYFCYELKSSAHFIPWDSLEETGVSKLKLADYHGQLPGSCQSQANNNACEHPSSAPVSPNQNAQKTSMK